jgi:hypothetical protein
MSLNNAVQAQRRRLWAYQGGLAETIGELPECPNLFRMINTSRGLKSNITGLSLGVKFGWTPLLGTFLQSYHELRSWMDGVNALKMRSGPTNFSFKGTDEWSFTDYLRPLLSDAGVVGSRYARWQLYQSLSRESEICYMARVDLKPRFTGAWDILSRLARLGGIPSLRTIWELTPRSFIVDWFVSVGDMISDIQGNLLYDMKIREQAWAWKIHEQLEYTWDDVVNHQRIGIQEIRAFYRSSTPPAANWLVPQIRLPTDLGKLGSLALIVAQMVPYDTKSVRYLARKYGFRTGFPSPGTD